MMLLALCTTFCLSQAYRTTAAMMASRLQSDFGLSAQQLGGFAGAFHFAFGGMQLFMGIGIDLFGIRRTLLVAFPFAVAGALVSGLSGQYAMVVLGQVMIGIGCAPAFLVCTVFIARSYAPKRFAPVSGMVMGVGGLGMLLTATPLAWLVEVSSWRAGFLALSAASVLAWLIIFLVVQDAAPLPVRPLPGALPGDGTAPGVSESSSSSTLPRESVGAALRSFGALFSMPHTPGIILLASVTYAAFMTLRGLWLGPLLLDRFGFTLVQSGNVALLVSVVSLIGPPLFGRLPASGVRRRSWIVGFTLLYALLFGMLAVVHGTIPAIVAFVLIGFLSGFIILQYADVRAAYPVALTGRAMALYTMAVFLGIGVMQWATGAVASLARLNGTDPYAAVLYSTSAALLLGAAAFWFLPRPPTLSTSSERISTPG